MSGLTTGKEGVGRALELPCGARLKNRLVKSAMSDSLGDGRGNPTTPQMRLYERWALGGAALAIIGEAQVDARYPEKPGNLILAPDKSAGAAPAGEKTEDPIFASDNPAGAAPAGEKTEDPIFASDNPAGSAQGGEKPANLIPDTDKPARSAGVAVIAPDAGLEALRQLARRGAANGCHLWTQLGHAGALAHLPISRPKGPSPLNVKGLRCDGMSAAEVAELPERYAAAAAAAQHAGFGGVQIHAGHGFLLSQFLSPLFNHRADAYGGAIARRFRVIADIIAATRHAVGDSFPIGIKINATDKLVGGLTPEDALEVVRLISKTSVDIIDVSGGTYFPGAAAASDTPRTAGPYFVDFAARAKQVTAIPIMATGGFATRAQAQDAISRRQVDAVGIARAFVLRPNLANDWLRDDGADPKFPVFASPPRGGITAWYTMRLTALGEDAEEEYELTPAGALSAYEARDDRRCEKWRRRL